MDGDQARDMEDLEAILLDPSAEPIKLSYGLLKFITQNFSKENEIGRGGFAVVYKGDLENEVVAVKVCTDIVTNKQFMDEIKCLKIANHKNIVRFLGYCAEKQEEIVSSDGKSVMAGERYRLLCFEYVPKGNIREYLEGGFADEPHGENWLARYQMIRGICQGLQHLHDKHIHHRDLKPENVMLDARMEAKITDFGLSRFLDQGETKMFTKNIGGTMRYMAREVIDRNEISYKSDIYALGIIMIELVTGVSMQSIQNWDESLDLLKCPRAEMCTEIARKCVDDTRDNRPTIDEVIRDLDKLESTIPNSSTNQAFSETELLDAYPLELKFPFEANQSSTRSVALSNKTDIEVGFIIAPYFDAIKVLGRTSGTVKPMSTLIVEMRLQHQEERVPMEENKVLIIMIMLKPDQDVVQIMYRALARGLHSLGEKPWTTWLSEKVTDMGGQMNWATLTALVCEHGPQEMVPVYSQGQEDNLRNFDLIKSIEAHARKPWVLVQLSSGTIYIWNWRIRKIIYTKPGPAASAIFVSQRDWIVIGGMSGSFSVYTCPYMELVKEVTPQKKVSTPEGKEVFHSGPITSLAVAPGSPFLMSYSQLNKMLLFSNLNDDGKDWSYVRHIEGIKPVKQLMFNPNDTRFFTVLEDDMTFEMWNLIDGQRVGTPNGLEYFAGQTDFLPSNGNNDRYLITITDRSWHLYSTSDIWDLEEGTRVHSVCMDEADGSSSITALACHPTRELFALLLVNHDTWVIQVWDSTTYRLKKEYWNKHKKPVDIKFIGTRRLLVAYADELSILEIDL